MTNEELQANLKDVDEKLVKLPDSDKLNKQERNERATLLMEKNFLEHVQKARDKGNLNDEVKWMAQYSMVKSTKNPWLLYLMQIKFRSHIFG